MKRFFYVTFDSLNFALVAGTSFSPGIAGAQNKGNLDLYICPSHLSVQLHPNSDGAKMFLLDVYIRPLWVKGLKHQHIYMCVFCLQRVECKNAINQSNWRIFKL